MYPGSRVAFTRDIIRYLEPLPGSEEKIETKLALEGSTGIVVKAVQKLGLHIIKLDEPLVESEPEVGVFLDDCEINNLQFERPGEKQQREKEHAIKYLHEVL